MTVGTSPPSTRPGWATVLAVLTLLFTFRVVAQLVQWVVEVPYLPPFEAWHSSTLPYPWLLASQGVILMVMVRLVWRAARQPVPPGARAAALCLWLGGVYFLVMLVRLLVGLTIAPQHPWFGATIPAFFHLLLAFFILVNGWLRLPAPAGDTP